MDQTIPSQFRALVIATRLRALPIPTIPVICGTVLAYHFFGAIDYGQALLLWLIAVFITIGTNLINDVIDFENGSDSINRVGHLKVLPAGYLSKGQVLIAGMTSLFLAVFLSIPIAYENGWLIFFMVSISAICGYSYTGGPYPISYLGLSEFFIFVCYGGVCVLSSFYVQTKMVNFGAILCAVQMGLLAIIPLAVNNFRDMNEDILVKKRTLAVRFGKTFARQEITFVVMTPFVLNLLWFFVGLWKVVFMPFVLLPFVLFFVKRVWEIHPGPGLNKYFAFSVVIHFLFGMLLSLGLIFS